MNGRPDNCRFGRGDWFRLTDPPRAKSAFDFMSNGTVAFQTHAGLPWLRYIRQRLIARGVHVRFWPFDEWVDPEQSAVVEVYPALWNKYYTEETDDMNSHQRDAYSVARWMSEKDQQGLLEPFFNPNLNEEQRVQAQMEGWIFGVMDPTDRN